MKHFLDVVKCIGNYVLCNRGHHHEAAYELRKHGGPPWQIYGACTVTK